MENIKKPWYFKKWGKDKICGITQSRLRQGKDKFGISYTTKLECGHSFYTKPLIEWSYKNSTCPMCRIHFNLLETIFKEYIVKE
jgi:hypothetical protein